jgi:hypothetical protein
VVTLSLNYESWLDGVQFGFLPLNYRECLLDKIKYLPKCSAAPKPSAHRKLSRTDLRMLKTNDAAAYLSISPWKLRNLVQSGEVSYIPGDGTSPWLFDKLELDRWIESRKVKL